MAVFLKGNLVSFFTDEVSRLSAFERSHTRNAPEWASEGVCRAQKALDILKNESSDACQIEIPSLNSLNAANFVDGFLSAMQTGQVKVAEEFSP